MADVEGSPDREGTVSVDGADLFFTEAGEGPPLFLVHGSGPDSRGWSPSFEDLARDHRVIAYDRRGYGRSHDAPLVGGWRQHGEDAAALIGELGAAPAAVVGWSGGGYVALHLAADHPELVRTIVLAETGLPSPPAVTASFVRALALARLQRPVRGERQAAETFLRWVMSEDGSSTFDRPDYPQERRERLLGNSRGIWADLSLRGSPDLSRDRLARVRCPVTLLVGDIGQPWFRRSAEALAERLPSATIRTIAGTNHAFTFHQPEAFAAAIRDAAVRS